MNFKSSVVVRAPFIIVGRKRLSRVVTVGVRCAYDWQAQICRERRIGVYATRCVAIDIPVEPFAGPIKDSVHRQARSRGRSERSEEHTSELQSLTNLVCRLLLEKKK